MGIITFIIGIIFIISGFSKALDFKYFVSIINNYCNFYPEIIANCIIILEIVLGIMILFRIALKYTSLICFIVVSLFTLIYTYGWVFLGIHDCGCFGKIQFINSSPAFFYVRNIILLLVLFFIYKTIDRNIDRTLHLSISYYIATIITTCVATFLCWNSSNTSFNKNMSISNEKIPIKNHILNNYIKVSSDSSYLISVFSYDCPHCINSFGNLSQYNNHDYIDKVIGLCQNNMDAKEKFVKFFKPSFEIKDLPEKDFYEISEIYPISFFVKNDSITKIIVGEIPSAFFLIQ